MKEPTPKCISTGEANGRVKFVDSDAESTKKHEVDISREGNGRVDFSPSRGFYAHISNHLP